MGKKRPPGFMIYRDEYAAIRKILSLEQKGTLLDSLFEFSDTGKEYCGDDSTIGIAFSILASAVRRNAEEYAHRCAVNAENRTKGWQKENSESGTIVNDCDQDNTNQTIVYDPGVTEPILSDPILSDPIRSDQNGNQTLFAIPSIEEIRVYCHQRGNNIDPESFFDYYAARNWMLKSGQRISDWHAQIRAWERNEGRMTKLNETATHVNGQRALYES